MDHLNQYKIQHITFKNIADLQSQLFLRQFSTEELVQYYVQAISKNTNNIFIECFAQEALEKAKQIDQKINDKEKLGKLFGVVVSIKDVFCYKGHIASASSAFLENHVAAYTATCIQKLLDEDAIIIGRVNCDEFAMGASNENSVYGAVQNPHDPTRITGGSSGGSAAAVAAQLCMISIGSDTGGSVRQPADFCGVYGLKPSYGRISRYGLIAYASSLDSVGIFANAIEDLTTVLQTMTGQDDFDSTCKNRTPIKTIPQKLKVAYFKEVVNYNAIEPEIKTTFVNVIKTYQKHHEIVAVDFNLLEFLVPTYYIISCAEATSNLARYDGIRYGKTSQTKANDLKQFYKNNRSEGFGKEVKRRIMLGNLVLSSGYYDAYYAKAQQIRQTLIDRIQELFETYDVLIFPNTPCLPWKIGEGKNINPDEMYLADIFSVLANLVSCPAVSIPISQHSTGLPLGTQIMGKQFAEEQLLEIAKNFMSEFNSSSFND